jgi:hypothetical protein
MKRKSLRPRPARYFFVVMALLFLVVAMFGFIPSYQALYQGLFHVDWIVEVHGAIMTAWLLVFIIQTILAARGNLRFHIKLGMASIALGVLVLLSFSFLETRRIIRDNPPLNDGLFDGWVLVLYTIALFGLFFTWGIIARRKPAIHKRLLFLSTLIILQPAIDRIQWLPLRSLQWTLFIYLDVLLIPLFIYDWIILKRIHKITWLGFLLIIIEQVSYLIMLGSPSWHNFWFNLFNKFR